MFVQTRDTSDQYSQKKAKVLGLMWETNDVNEKKKKTIIDFCALQFRTCSCISRYKVSKSRFKLYIHVATQGQHNISFLNQIQTIHSVAYKAKFMERLLGSDFNETGFWQRFIADATIGVNSMVNINFYLTGSQTYLLLTSKITIKHSEIEPEPVNIFTGTYYHNKTSSV